MTAAWWAELARTAWAILIESGAWVVLSLAVGGLVHEFLPTSPLRKVLNRPGLGATAGAVALGAVLPICSCGVVPLAVSLFRSGVRLAPVMAFAAATPVINPAAVVLSLGLLGPELTLAYVALGLTLPLLLGLVSERWGDRRPPPRFAFRVQGRPASDTAPVSPGARITRGLRWGLLELGPSIGFYLVLGVLLAALLATVLPGEWMEDYLGGSSLLALLAAGLLGASIYVCAVAHIPMVATLLAAGAAPGVAIVFLVTGTATNLPELVTLYRTIGRRTVLIYSGGLVLGSLVAGLAVNAWLGADFQPTFDPLASLALTEQAAGWQPRLSAGVNTAAAALVALLGAYGTLLRLRGWRQARARRPQ
jgi:hypothetical protein